VQRRRFGRRRANQSVSIFSATSSEPSSSWISRANARALDFGARPRRDWRGIQRQDSPDVCASLRRDQPYVDEAQRKTNNTRFNSRKQLVRQKAGTSARLRSPMNRNEDIRPSGRRHVPGPRIGVAGTVTERRKGVPSAAATSQLRQSIRQGSPRRKALKIGQSHSPGPAK